MFCDCFGDVIKDGAEVISEELLGEVKGGDLRDVRPCIFSVVILVLLASWYGCNSLQ